jgi:hypothetical protein
MKKLLPLVLLPIVLILLAGALMWGYFSGRGELAEESNGEKPIAASLRVKMVGGEPVITIDAAEQAQSGIETASLPRVNYQPAVKAYGTALDPQPLADLANSIAAARADVQVAEAQLAAAKATYERAQSLYRDQRNVSAAQFQAAQAEFLADRAKQAAAQTRLDGLATSAKLAWGPALGQAVVERAPLLTRLLDREEALVQLTAAPGKAPPTAPATGFLQSDGEKPMPLTLVSPAPRTDPRLQGASYFYLASAQSGLTPGMNVVARLPAGPPLEGAAAPVSALVWFAGRAWIYLRTGPETFLRRAVAPDRRTERGDIFVGAVPKDARVVATGAQTLLSEELRADIKVEEE